MVDEHIVQGPNIEVYGTWTDIKSINIVIAVNVATMDILKVTSKETFIIDIKQDFTISYSLLGQNNQFDIQLIHQFLQPRSRCYAVIFFNSDYFSILLNNGNKYNPPGSLWLLWNPIFFRRLYYAFYIVLVFFFDQCCYVIKGSA